MHAKALGAQDEVSRMHAKALVATRPPATTTATVSLVTLCSGVQQTWEVTLRHGAGLSEPLLPAASL